MSLISFVAEKIARSKVNRAREGKEGKDMQKVLKALDGNKRYIVCGMVVVSCVAALLGHPIEPGVKLALSLLNWNEADSIIPVAQVAQLAAAVWAIVSGLRKDREAKEAAK